MTIEENQKRHGDLCLQHAEAMRVASENMDRIRWWNFPIWPLYLSRAQGAVNQGKAILREMQSLFEEYEHLLWAGETSPN